MTILDSGDRREFDTGAYRDIQSGKGRCDLLPLRVASELVIRTLNVADGSATRAKAVAGMLSGLEQYRQTRYYGDWYDAMEAFAVGAWREGTEAAPVSAAKALLDVSRQMEQGAQKYGERNWERGIPLHSYADSAIRHALKYLRGDRDEDHRTAALWNLCCGLWTIWERPELDDFSIEPEKDDGCCAIGGCCGE